MAASKVITIGRTKLEAFAGSGGLFNVILHGAKGQQQVELTPGEFEALELAAASISIAERRAEADRLEINRVQLQRDEAREAIEAMRVCIIYTRDRRGGAFDFDTWIRLVEHALEKGQLPPHALEEAQAETLMFRQALANVQKERDELRREVEELRRRQAAFVEAASHGS